jgi:glycosyltransferase involved in cell wall biosynthesis
MIIIDDGSSDDGPEKVLPYISEKIHIVKQENKGVSAARNHGISIAKNTYIAFLDADDFWHKEYLLRVLEAIKLFPKAGVFGTQYVKNELNLKDSNSKVFENIDYFSVEMQKKFILLTSGVVVHKDFFKFNLGFNENLTRGEDRDVWYRAVCFFGYPIYIPKPLVYYAKEDDNSLMKRKFPVNKHLISIIGKEGYCQINNNLIDPKVFEKFRLHFVYFGVTRFFNDYDNIDDIKYILSKNFKKSLLLDLFYRLPNKFLFWFFSSKRRKYRFSKICKYLFLKN